MRKLHVVGGDINYINWMRGIILTENPDEADILYFTGGADANPALYGENKGKYTHTNQYRDAREIEIFLKYKDKFKIGCCRGSQFLTAMSGGKLIQHVTGHIGDHYITTKDKEQFKVTSTHHQMLYPFNIKHDMIAWSTNNRSTVYLNGDNEEIVLPKGFVEPEIVWYPESKSLGIQSHPEKQSKNMFHEYLNILITEYYNKYGRSVVEV